MYMFSFLVTIADRSLGVSPVLGPSAILEIGMDDRHAISCFLVVSRC